MLTNEQFQKVVGFARRHDDCIEKGPNTADDWAFLATEEIGFPVERLDFLDACDCGHVVHDEWRGVHPQLMNPDCPLVRPY
jgi:hypothetical protein